LVWIIINYLAQSVWVFNNIILLSTDEDITKIGLVGCRDYLLIVVEPRMEGLRPIGAYGG